MFQKIHIALKSNLTLVAFVLLGAVAFFASADKKQRDPLETHKAPASVDTYIPRGHVLVPIEVSNAESLTSLLGDMGGVVDLYLASNDRQKGGLKVGSKLKILRAPLNPEQYAVLVKDSESPRLLSFSGPFIAVVQNPDEKGTEVRTTSAPRKIHVDYQN